jgi:hypothetical protein
MGKIIKIKSNEVKKGTIYYYTRVWLYPSDYSRVYTEVSHQRNQTHFVIYNQFIYKKLFMDTQINFLDHLFS